MLACSCVRQLCPVRHGLSWVRPGRYVLVQARAARPRRGPRRASRPRGRVHAGPGRTLRAILLWMRLGTVSWAHVPRASVHVGLDPCALWTLVPGSGGKATRRSRRTSTRHAGSSTFLPFLGAVAVRTAAVITILLVRTTGERGFPLVRAFGEQYVVRECVYKVRETVTGRFVATLPFSVLFYLFGAAVANDDVALRDDAFQFSTKVEGIQEVLEHPRVARETSSRGRL